MLVALLKTSNLLLELRTFDLRPSYGKKYTAITENLTNLIDSRRHHSLVIFFNPFQNPFEDEIFAFTLNCDWQWSQVGPAVGHKQLTIKAETMDIHGIQF